MRVRRQPFSLPNCLAPSASLEPHKSPVRGEPRMRLSVFYEVEIKAQEGVTRPIIPQERGSSVGPEWFPFTPISVMSHI